MKLEWFLNKEPLLFKSSFTPVYDYGFIALSISKVYPDDFGEFSVRVSNKFGSAVMVSIFKFFFVFYVFFSLIFFSHLIL